MTWILAWFSLPAEMGIKKKKTAEAEIAVAEIAVLFSPYIFKTRLLNFS